MNTLTYEHAELQAALSNIEVALTKLRRLVDESEDRDVVHRVRGVVIKLDDAKAALRRV